jgi:hypothetical protein
MAPSLVVMHKADKTLRDISDTVFAFLHEVRMLRESMTLFTLDTVMQVLPLEGASVQSSGSLLKAQTPCNG